MPADLTTIARLANTLSDWQQRTGYPMDRHEAIVYAHRLRDQMNKMVFRPKPAVTVFEGGSIAGVHNAAHRQDRQNPRLAHFTDLREIDLMIQQLEEGDGLQHFNVEGKPVYSDDMPFVTGRLGVLAREANQRAQLDVAPIKIPAFESTATGQATFEDAAQMAREQKREEGGNYVTLREQHYRAAMKMRWDYYLQEAVPGDRRPMILGEREALTLADELAKCERSLDPDIGSGELTNILKREICERGVDQGFWFVPDYMQKDAYWETAMRMGLGDTLPDYREWAEPTVQDKLRLAQAVGDLDLRGFEVKGPVTICFHNDDNLPYLEAVQRGEKALYVFDRGDGEPATIRAYGAEQGLTGYVEVASRGKEPQRLNAQGDTPDSLFSKAQAAAASLSDKPQSFDAIKAVNDLEREWGSLNTNNPTAWRDLGEKTRQALPEIARSMPAPDLRGVDEGHRRFADLAHRAQAGDLLDTPLRFAAPDGAGERLKTDGVAPQAFLRFSRPDDQNNVNIRLESANQCEGQVTVIDSLTNVPADMQNRNEAAIELARKHGVERVGIHYPSGQLLSNHRASEVFAITKDNEAVSLGVQVTPLSVNAGPAWEHTPRAIGRMVSKNPQVEQFTRTDAEKADLTKVLAVQSQGVDADPDDLAMTMHQLNDGPGYKLLLPEGKGQVDIPDYVMTHSMKENFERALAHGIAQVDTLSESEQTQLIEQVRGKSWTKLMQHYDATLEADHADTERLG